MAGHFCKRLGRRQEAGEREVDASGPGSSFEPHPHLVAAPADQGQGGADSGPSHGVDGSEQPALLGDVAQVGDARVVTRPGERREIISQIVRKDRMSPPEQRGVVLLGEADLDHTLRQSKHATRQCRERATQQAREPRLGP